jgi:5-histidylcysteine sulfoxide synthase/putative 4-mercaptohistidine N1-methyltranferase
VSAHLPLYLTGDDPHAKREEIRSYFHATFSLYEKLFEAVVSDDVFYEQPEPTRHPLIFYFGHTAAFFINKLIAGGIISKHYNANFESMFAVGVDEMVWDDLEKAHYSWPSVDQVRAYRNELRSFVDEQISTLPLKLPITQEDPFWVILMGIEHESIHFETSSVLLRQLDIKQVKPHIDFPICTTSGSTPKNSMVKVAAQTVALGKSLNHNQYGWDNEYGHKTEVVDDFVVSQSLISNEEFLAFVEDGGYRNKAYWDEEGQHFLAESKASCPVFWVPQTEGYRYRAMLQEIDMPLNWPVDVNVLEAMAYCRYKSEKEAKSYRLLSEAEWYVLRDEAGLEEFPKEKRMGNSNLQYYASACPVDTFSFGKVFDVQGNVWQWTQTHMDAYEGFKEHRAYDDFSIPTFDGKHNILKGGSFISTGNELMKYSRYAFRRHFYQHAGFRVVEGDLMSTNEDNIYESDVLVSQYCEFQYGKSYFGVENFAQKCAELASKYSNKHGNALDLGCATGRATFELAKSFDKVCGIDFSARFVQEGASLQKRGKVTYNRQDEGELMSHHEHTLEELGLTGLNEKVEFWQGDACNLKAHYCDYDLIMATNLIDRLYDPMLFLDDVAHRLNQDGVLVLTSPYTWLEEYTPKEKWLGGYVDKEGNAVHTLDTLKKVLGEHFEFVEAIDVPFVIRETPRKYQHTLSQMSVWRKK